MTEDLIAMAREANCGYETMDLRWKAPDGLERFAALIEARAVARTREECAAAIDKWAIEAPFIEEQCAGEECAQAIRALGERT